MNEKILIIDDEADILLILENILTEEGYYVMCASGGDEALELFKSESVDLVITDMSMPKMDGLSVMRRLKKMDEDIEVIILTAFADLENVIQAFRDKGAYDYLTKPLENIDALLITVCKALESRRLKIENKALLEKLTQSKKDLERRVEERTAELNEANEQLQSELTRRKVAEKALQKVNDDLELRVKERTAELMAVNEQLKQEMEERKQTEEALRDSEEKYRTVLAAIPDPVIVYDKEGKVIYLSPAFTRVFGWTLDERLGKKMDFFVPEENWPETQMMIDKVKAGDDFSGIESRRFTKEGNIIDVILSAAVYKDSDGNPVGSVINLRDITEQKRLQAETMRVGHLASLGEMAAGVAHEINNPINGVIGYAEILRDQYRKQGQDLNIPERIIKEADRVAEIVKNLLSFARDQKEEYSPAYINDIISDTLGLVEKQIIKDGIELSVNIPPELPKIRARRQELQQVFVNIISNARYALNQRYPEISKDKSLEMNGETVELEGRKHVRTTIFDRGIGIPIQILDRLCDPFFSTKPKNEGTGLGLSISHGIIKKHGGRLLVESVEGEYTKVMVDLPVS